MDSVAVLMACFNRKEKTLFSLKNVYNQKGIGLNFEIHVFLLDDGSTDGTSEEVGLTFPQVNLLKGDGKHYWNRGMHKAWEAASKYDFDYYLWLNDDTNLYDFAFLELLESSKQTNSRCIICGCIESPLIKGKLTYGGGRMVGKKYVSNYPTGVIQKCDKINGNCVLIPRYVYERVGNLDRRFVHAIGDNDYSLRAKKIGIVSVTTRNFIAACDNHETLPKWCLPNIRFIERVKNLYSPLGYSHPREFFIYESRHFGYLTAFKHLFSMHVRLFFPRLWN